MKDHRDHRNLVLEHGTGAEIGQQVMDWCRWQACQAHGDEALARVLHRCMGYAVIRRGLKQISGDLTPYITVDTGHADHS